MYLPPFGERLQGFETGPGELGEDFHGGHRAHVLDPEGVVTAREHGDQDHLLSGEPEVLPELGRGEVLAVLVLVEEVLVHRLPAEDPDVAVVGDGAVGEADRVEEGALGLRLRGRHDPRHAEHLEELLAVLVHLVGDARREPVLLAALGDQLVLVAGELVLKNRNNKLGDVY